MIALKKPKIGLLGLMIEGYEPLFPGIIEVQAEHARAIAASVSDIADIDFPGVAYNRKKIEETVKHFQDAQCDGILMVLLAYSHAGWIVNAMRDNKLPLAMAVLQPDDTVTPAFTEYDFTRNQGIHGSQDNANILMRMGIPCQFFAGSRNSDRFRAFFSDFARAARTYTALRGASVSVIGKMTGMGDLFTDDIRIQEITGAEFCYDSIGSIYSAMGKVDEREIAGEISREKEIYEIDPNMPDEAYAYAVRQYFGMKHFLEQKEYDAFTLHFETLGEDGRFTSLPFLGASRLLEDGYGYAAEGDALCALGVLASRLISGGDVTFSEMYAMDYPTGSILLCHAGEGNPKIAGKDKKPRLVYKVFNEGGLDNPPTVLFTPEPGRATVVSFAPSADGFKIIASVGSITEKCDLDGCEMPYLFFKPDTPMEELVEAWLAFGGTHHEAIMYGDTRRALKMLAAMWGCEFTAL